MDSVIDYAKQEILLAVYRSISRMNDCILAGDIEGANREQHLQKVYRKHFEELSHE